MKLAMTKKLRRRWIVLLSSMAFVAVLLVPASTPSLGSIECAAPPYFDAFAGAEPHADHEAGMSALRQQAGLALAELRTKNAGN